MSHPLSPCSLCGLTGSSPPGSGAQLSPDPPSSTTTSSGLMPPPSFGSLLPSTGGEVEEDEGMKHLQQVDITMSIRHTFILHPSTGFIVRITITLDILAECELVLCKCSYFFILSQPCRRLKRWWHLCRTHPLRRSVSLKHCRRATTLPPNLTHTQPHTHTHTPLDTHTPTLPIGTVPCPSPTRQP